MFPPIPKTDFEIFVLANLIVLNFLALEILLERLVKKLKGVKT